MPTGDETPVVPYCGKCKTMNSIHLAYIDLVAVSRCWCCGTLHVRGMSLDSLKRQFETPLQRTNDWEE